MKTVQSLIDEYNRKINFVEIDIARLAKLYQEFLSQVKELPSPVEQILVALQKMVQEPCMKDDNLWLSAAQEHPSLLYLDALISILSTEKSCILYEDVICVLKKLKAERAIPALEKALEYDFDSDVFYRIAIDSLDALYEIGTEEAINVIKKASNSPIERIREEAIDILK